MTTFLRLLAESNKAVGLEETCAAVRAGAPEQRVFQVDPASFKAVPGSPFAYWVGDQIRELFIAIDPFENGARTAKAGLATNDDARFLRLFWEVDSESISRKGRWVPLAKGGSPSAFYSDLPFVVSWANDGAELKAFASAYRSSHGWGDQWTAMINATEYYFRSGFTWPLRASHFAPSVLPEGCAFSKRGCGGFAEEKDLPWLIALLSSSCADFIFKLLLGRFGHPEFAGGALQRMPIPSVNEQTAGRLERLMRQSWAYKYLLDTVEETSHAFLLPLALRGQNEHFDPAAIQVELKHLQSEIDNIAFELYRFNETDRSALEFPLNAGIDETPEDNEVANDDDEDDDNGPVLEEADGLLSWAVGIAFGRFDIRLATLERDIPPAPEPFDPLPTQSPGMLPSGMDPHNGHNVILLDDNGHMHDLPRMVEEVLAHLGASVSLDVRPWLRRKFFPLHLQMYSKSRRKSPIYWPISTASGKFTFWIYYPNLTNQTLYTAVNDFLEPKLEQVVRELSALRNKGINRSRDDDKGMEMLQMLEKELSELRDSLLQIAPIYDPFHDDGVQITAAPLWALFRHKPWQKLLKETWVKLEKGDYDWAHLAMAYWPDRVRKKCKTDKSLAIAHGLEELYEPPLENTAGRGRGDRKRRGVAP